MVGINKLKNTKAFMIIYKQFMMFMKIWKTMINKEKQNVNGFCLYDSRYGI